MNNQTQLSRRALLQGMAAMVAATGGAALLGGCAVPVAAPTTGGESAAQAPAAASYELVHWHGLSASDGDIWNALVKQFNDAHAAEGVSILAELVAEQLGTKTLGAFAAGDPPDFGWADAGAQVSYVKQGVILDVTDLMTGVGLNFDDFFANALETCKYQGKLYQVPMDSMSIQMLVNTGHAKEAGLDPAKLPATGEELVEWAKAMSQRDGDTVTRSGFLLTGSGTLPAYVWGTVAEQLGFQRFNEDFTKVDVMNDACRQAAQWVLDLFDTHQVANRDIADRYKAFGTGQGSMFWTGPWTLSGYAQTEGLEFASAFIPLIGQKPWTIAYTSGLEVYTRDDTERLQVTANAIKWLSDNSLVWNVDGRGAATRKSIRENPEYTNGKTVPWALKQPFEDGMEFAFNDYAPVLDGTKFDYYGGPAKQLDAIWNKNVTIEEGLQALQDEWQGVLDIAAKS